MTLYDFAVVVPYLKLFGIFWTGSSVHPLKFGWVLRDYVLDHLIVNWTHDFKEQ